MKKEKLMIDNNAIDIDIIRENESLLKIIRKKYNFYVSPSVLEELSKIKDDKLEDRIRNIIALIELNPKFIYDSVFIWDHSRFDCACLGNGEVYKKILNESKNNINDAIIADTSVNNNCILFTCDKRFYNKMKRYGYKCVNLDDLKEIAKN